MSKIKINPLQNRVLVKAVELPPASQTIIIPDCAKEKSMEAEVIAVGPGKSVVSPGPAGSVMTTFETITVKSGDRVLVSKYAGTELEVEGEQLRIVTEDDILARVSRK